MQDKAYLYKLAPCLIALIFLLAACGAGQSETPTLDSPATISALQAENAQLKTQAAETAAAAAILPPTSTLKPPTPTPLPFTSTPTATSWATAVIPTDTVTLTHLGAPGYVFLVDPTLWIQDRTSGETDEFLAHKNLEGCRLDLASAEEFPLPLGYYPRLIGRRYWLAREYGQNAIYQLPDLALDLGGFSDELCFADQQEIMEELLTREEYTGGPLATSAPTPTARPPITDFTCQGALAPRLRIGDNASIVAGFLWLREEPRVSKYTEVRIFQQYAPVSIKVIAGPECVRPYVYWQVEVSELGPEGEILNGWMAESDGKEYFLDVWYLGW
ncbi:MAG: hypothetical protein JXA78_19230 [Anaerolineales bacterium]|nr:hypothetical protein [Anaerolineales bacterium]